MVTKKGLARSYRAYRKVLGGSAGQLRGCMQVISVPLGFGRIRPRRGFRRGFDPLVAAR